MGFLALPAVILIIALPGFTPAAALADFSRFSQAEGEEIAIVDMFGAERLGRVVAASDTSVTVGFGATTQVFDRADVLKADRLRDGVGDGLVKGLLVGAIVGWVAARESPGRAGDTFFGAVTAYGGIGFLLDRANTDRSPLYRK